jgi:hypothetical protein
VSPRALAALAGFGVYVLVGRDGGITEHAERLAREA